MTILETPMTVVRARMLSEALSQYVDNANHPDDQSLAERMNVVLALSILDEVNTFLADGVH